MTVYTKPLVEITRAPATRSASDLFHSRSSRLFNVPRVNLRRRVRALVEAMSGPGVLDSGLDMRSHGLLVDAARLASLERALSTTGMRPGNISSWNKESLGTGGGPPAAAGWTPSTKTLGRRGAQTSARSRALRLRDTTQPRPALRLSSLGREDGEARDQLSLEEERRLGRDIQAARRFHGTSDGGEDGSKLDADTLRRATLTEQILVTRNTRLIHFVARRMQQYSVHAEDLFAEGMVALRRAAQAYDPDKGYAFATFAIPVVHRHLEQTVHSLSRSIYLPSNRIILIKKFQSMRWALERQLGRPPRLAEVAAAMQLSEHAVASLRADAQTTASLEATEERHNGEVWIKEWEVQAETADPGQHAVREMKDASLRTQLAHLSPTERMVVMARHGMLSDGPASTAWQELGHWMGLSANRVHQIYVAAINKLRKRMLEPRP